MNYYQPYNPYYGQPNMMQQPQRMQQPMPQPVGLQGKSVDSIEVVKQWIYLWMVLSVTFH